MKWAYKEGGKEEWGGQWRGEQMRTKSSVQKYDDGICYFHASFKA